MARIDLTPPPKKDGAPYHAYRSWLERELYLKTCVYCLLPGAATQIDHVVPTSLDASRTHDPTNLVLACGSCNGRGGKGDYHPDHRARRRLPHDRTGFEVLDIRQEDVGELFEVEPSGALVPRSGPQADRALWNVVLFKLDRKVEARAQLLNLLKACELADEHSASASGVERDDWLAILDQLLPTLAANLIFFRALNIKISPTLLAKAAPLREVRRPPQEGYGARQR